MKNVYDYIGDKIVRRKLDSDESMRLYRLGLTDMQIAVRLGVTEGTVYDWRREHGLRPNGKLDNDQCRTCVYWKNGNGSYDGWNIRFCHHLLDTDKRRVILDDGSCGSHKKREKK